jgi:teichuronic acid biosynthesis glycosyltransferase TuaC
VRALVVAEFYPRAEDPVLGVWAHRQTVATRDAGADVQVVVLHRVVPSRRDVAGGPRAALRSLAAKARQPRDAVLDGVPVRYASYVSPPRGAAYGSWGAWAAPALRRALRGLGPFDVVHAHNAVPPGDAVRRLGLGLPLVVSVHGGDVFHTAARTLNVTRTLGGARLVLANSDGTAKLARGVGAARVRVVRLGTDLPPEAVRPPGPPRLVTVAHLVGRKRHADVLRLLPRLDGVAYDVIGAGPERAELERLAAELGVADRVVFHGQLPHDEALAVARRADVFVLPATDEAFGVAYVEAMAGGLPAVGLRGEPGPAEIAGTGPGMLLAPRDDPEGLLTTVRRALDERERLGRAARATVAAHFTWERCGRMTVAAYARALERRAV